MLESAMIGLSKFIDANAGPIRAIVTVVILWVVYLVITKGVKKYLYARAFKEDNVLNFLMLWRYGWLGVGTIFVIISFSGSLASLGLSAAFLGMVLGWSLQAPVTGIAAWLMILLKRPFKIGDRIIISGIIGDVLDITLTHVYLDQVGGTIGGEERSGRGVLIPNATLFQQIIHNYTIETDFILDEVPVLVTFQSDLAEAERIMLEAANEVTADIIKETGTAPFTRLEIADSGLRIRLRYNTLATDRQRLSSDMCRIIFLAFAQSDKVEFCYPHSEIIYRQKGTNGGHEGQAHLDVEIQPPV